jgi:hypothetical protein
MSLVTPTDPGLNVAPSAAGKAVQVTDCRLDTNHGVWSPDGKRFAFA